MSDSEQRWEVTKILQRKLDDNGDFHYLLKWKNFRKPSWEPSECVDQCDELLEEFHKKQAKRVINMRLNGCVEYLMEQIDGIPPSVLPSATAIEKWPKLVFDFLEENIRFYTTMGRNDASITEADNVVGDPIKISYVTNVSDINKLQYWCDYPLAKGKFVQSAQCIESWPRKVQSFLESKIQLVNNENSYPHQQRMVTRRERRLAAQFDQVYGVCVDRKTNFDKVLITKQLKNVRNRRTIGVPQPAQVMPRSILVRRNTVAARMVTFANQVSFIPTSNAQSTLAAISPINVAPSVAPVSADSATANNTNALVAPSDADSNAHSPLAAASPINVAPSVAPVSIDPATANNTNALVAPSDTAVLANPDVTNNPDVASRILVRRTYSPTVAQNSLSNAYGSKIMVQKP